MGKNIFNKIVDKFTKVVDTDDNSVQSQNVVDRDDEGFHVTEQDEISTSAKRSRMRSGTSKYTPRSYDTYEVDTDTVETPSPYSSSSYYGDTNPFRSSSYSSPSSYSGSNIFDIKSAPSRQTGISKVLYFCLDDVEDTRNVADAVSKKDSVILVEFSRLDPMDIPRATSFLDGVIYIFKAKSEQIDTMFLIVPESIELSGDFYSQVSIGRG